VLYSFGAEWNPAACNSREGGQGGTAPARSFESFATRWHSGAILNLAGNVWEWCDDWAFALTGAAATKGAFVVEPVGSAQAAQMRRLIKGGSFLADRLGCMVASRLWADPRLCAEDGGIRVVR
jgi:formylglycine-generating enzyme required for sulfatase activity